VGVAGGGEAMLASAEWPSTDGAGSGREADDLSCEWNKRPIARVESTAWHAVRPRFTDVGLQDRFQIDEYME